MPYFDQDDPLGTDFSGVDDIDNNLTMVSGRKMLAQAIVRRWITDPGGLFYDPEYGAGLLNYLSDIVDDVGSIAALLSAEARKDERVEDCQVSVVWDAATETLSVDGRIETAVGPFSLTLKLSEDNPLTLEVLDGST